MQADRRCFSQNPRRVHLQIVWEFKQLAAGGECDRCRASWFEELTGERGGTRDRPRWYRKMGGGCSKRARGREENMNRLASKHTLAFSPLPPAAEHSSAINSGFRCFRGEAHGHPAMDTASTRDAGLESSLLAIHGLHSKDIPPLSGHPTFRSRSQTFRMKRRCF